MTHDDELDPSSDSIPEGDATADPTREESVPVPGMKSFDAITYRPETGTYRVTFDSTLDTPSVAAIRIVAALTDRPSMELDRLYDHIDPDLLDSLLTPLGDGSTRGTGRITFTYHGYDVTFHSDGVIEVAVRDEPTGVND